MRSRKEINKLKAQNEKLHNKIIKYVKKIERGRVAAGRLYILVFDLVQDLYQSAFLLNETCAAHVINLHSPPKKKYAQMLNDLTKDLSSYIQITAESIEHLNFENHMQIETQKNKILHIINKKLDDQIVDIQSEELGNRIALLQTRILLETKDIVAVVHRMYLLYYEFVHDSVAKLEKQD